MKRIPSWLVLLGALLVVGLLSAVLPNIIGNLGASGGSGGGSNPFAGLAFPSIDTSVGNVPLPKPLANLIGIESLPDVVIFGILTAIVVGAVVATSIPIWFLYRMLDNGVTNVKDDEEYKAGVAEIEQRRVATNKQYLQDSPPTPIPSHDRPGWTAFSTSALMALLLSYFGAAFSDNFMGGSNQALWAAGFALAGLLTGLIFFRKTWVIKNASQDSEPVDWGMIWVVLTGVVVLGIGLGVMMWVRVQGGV